MKTVPCKTCRKEIIRYPSQLGNNYCSRKCAGVARRSAKEVKCKQCGKKFFRSPSQIKPLNFCSQDCCTAHKIEELKNYERVTPKSEVGRHGKRMVNGRWSTKKADLEFSRWIRQRDGQRCVRCGRTSNLTCSHFWGRTHSGTRYDPENCITLCWMPCHVTMEKEKQGHYRDLVLEQLGQEGYDILEQRARSVVKREQAIIECMKLLGATK